ADPGNQVSAPSGGIVSFVGHIVDRPVVVIDHGSGLLTSLEPVRSTLARGAIVGPGDEVGMIGTGAHCTRRCLHWGLRLDGQYIDPLLTLRDTRPSVLLPLD
ncbi:MAG: M23 family metallopeptidase, partial [Micrococcaceae bacterium]|nr:M23 family metallopeptidase [Micrococcaceae bacterium]